MLEKGTLPDRSLTSLGKELWNFLGIVGMDWWPWLIKSEGTQPHDWSLSDSTMKVSALTDVFAIPQECGYCAVILWLLCLHGADDCECRHLTASTLTVTSPRQQQHWVLNEWTCFDCLHCHQSAYHLPHCLTSTTVTLFPFLSHTSPSSHPVVFVWKGEPYQTVPTTQSGPTTPFSWDTYIRSRMLVVSHLDGLPVAKSMETEVRESQSTFCHLIAVWLDNHTP